jgi:hypothetical protein
MSNNKWIQHVKKTQTLLGSSYKEAMKEAKKTYKKGQKGLPKGQKGTGPAHVKASQLIYKPLNQRGNFGNYQYKTGDAEKAYWENPTEIIIAFRGTVNKQDVKTDAILAVGQLKSSSRYKRDLIFTKRIMKITNKKIILTGHSLGGAIAKNIANELGLKAYIYNAGSGPREALGAKLDKVACTFNKKGKRCRKAKLVQHERTIGDPVSILGKKGVNVKHILPKKLNVHSIDNFDSGGL